MRKHNEFLSVCDVCRQKGWHKKETPCVRTYTKPCESCGSCENGELRKCKGINRIIDYSDIAEQFIPYFESGERVKVKFTYGKGKNKETEIKSGTIGMTTGWKPVFLLMLRSNSRGSSYTLSSKDEIL